MFQTQSESVSVVIGDPSMNCGRSDEICNGPLNPSTEYQFKDRVYTNDDDDQFIESSYSMDISTCEERERERERERPSFSSSTAATAADNTPLIAGVIVGVLLGVVILVVVSIVIFLVVYRKCVKKGEYAFM